MKQILSYLLVMVFTFQSIGLNASNMASFDNLVAHYEHHKLNHHTTFFEFIDLHYGSQKQTHKNEHEEHEDLPFQKNQHLSHHCYFEIPQIVSIQLNTIIQSIQHNFNYSSQFNLLIATDILQPPKH